MSNFRVNQRMIKNLLKEQQEEDLKAFFGVSMMIKFDLLNNQNH